MTRILALILSAALVLPQAACSATHPTVSEGDGAQSAPGYVNPSRMALTEPVYPDFPAYPQEPEDGNWENYYQQYNAYCEALRELRGDGLSREAREGLNAFSGRSVPLALAGHEGENAVYSPLSLWSALAMLAQCAAGDSRQQVLDALGADSTEELQEQVSAVWRGLYTDDGSSSLLLANSIWLNSGMESSYVQDTLNTLAQQYYAGAYNVPMGTDMADQAVTSWIDRQTNGLIGGGEPVVQTDSLTLALLVSSLYYRAGWSDKFAPEQTWEDVFTSAGGEESTADFMHRTEQAAFLDRADYRAAQLSTQLGEMVFILPDEGVTPESLLSDSDFLSRLDLHSEDAHYGEVRWSVPKFDVDSDLDLMDSLAALGITDLVDENKADLSSLTTLEACLSGAKQLTRVKVDEEGVEAAAATILMMACTSAMPEDDPEVCVMDLDRPFLFVIRSSGVPLFVGVVNQIG